MSKRAAEPDQVIIISSSSSSSEEELLTQEDSFDEYFQENLAIQEYNENVFRLRFYFNALDWKDAAEAAAKWRAIGNFRPYIGQVDPDDFIFWDQQGL